MRPGLRGRAAAALYERRHAQNKSYTYSYFVLYTQLSLCTSFIFVFSYTYAHFVLYTTAIIMLIFYYVLYTQLLFIVQAIRTVITR